MSSVTSTGASIVAGARASPRAGSPSASPSRAASSGWTCSVQRSRPARRASAGCASTSCSSAGARRPISTQAAVGVLAERGAAARGTSASERLAGASSILPARRAQHLGQARLRAGRGRCRAAPPPSVGRGVSRRTGRRAACRSSSRSGPARGASGQQLGGVAAADRASLTSRPTALGSDEVVERARRRRPAPWPGDDRRSGAAGSPTRRASPAGGGEHRRRVVRDVADRERVERDVVVRAARAATAPGRITSAWRVVSLR